MALEYLGLYGNNISSIEDNTFVDLKRLKFLDLGSNHLESLSPGTFCGLESIKELRLGDNRLPSLPQDAFIHLPRPLELDLYGNQHECDTALCWLRQEELNGTITWYRDFGYTGKPVCVNGVNWDTWSCNQTGDMSLINVLSHLNTVNCILKKTHLFVVTTFITQNCEKICYN